MRLAAWERVVQPSIPISTDGLNSSDTILAENQASEQYEKPTES
jgi:hypothetical protein